MRRCRSSLRMAGGGDAERLLADGDDADVAPTSDGCRFPAYGMAGTAAIADLYSVSQNYLAVP